MMRSTAYSLIGAITFLLISAALFRSFIPVLLIGIAGAVLGFIIANELNLYYEKRDRNFVSDSELSRFPVQEKWSVSRYLKAPNALVETTVLLDIYVWIKSLLKSGRQ